MRMILRNIVFIFLVYVFYRSSLCANRRHPSKQNVSNLLTNWQQIRSNIDCKSIAICVHIRLGICRQSLLTCYARRLAAEIEQSLLTYYASRLAAKTEQSLLTCYANRLVSKIEQSLP
ncbi:hypothetical protein P5V15_001129 [Pogonomyrmex californicus]